jgi:arabinosaccharide transport system substrate-binding protein
MLLPFSPPATILKLFPSKPLAILLILAIASGTVVLTRPTEPRPSLLIWCFADSHARTYRDAYTSGNTPFPSLLDQFHTNTGLTARVQLIGQLAEDLRLVSLFMSSHSNDSAPDLCEIEINAVGKFFRPPADDVGLLPLNHYLQNSGQFDRILKSRFAPWSKFDPHTGQTLIFGIPNDVHPVTIVYRKDLFDQANIDLSQAKTWNQFQDACLQFQNYQSKHGHPQRRAIEMSASSPDTLVMMLLQRHINLVDANNQLHLSDPKVIDTLCTYTQMVAGPRAIGGETSPYQAQWTQSLIDADISALCTPDWRAGDLQQFAPQLTGQLRMIPLPKFDPNDSPTSTWGGTMIGIPKTCKHPDQAWQLLQFLYLSPQGNAARLSAGSQILPPIPQLWADPVYHQPNPYFGNQKIMELYTTLAPQIPERIVTPYTIEAEIVLARALYLAQDYLNDYGPTGLHQAAAQWLTQAQQDMQRRIQFGEFPQ